MGEGNRSQWELNMAKAHDRCVCQWHQEASAVYSEYTLFRNVCTSFCLSVLCTKGPSHGPCKGKDRGYSPRQCYKSSTILTRWSSRKVLIKGLSVTTPISQKGKLRHKTHISRKMAQWVKACLPQDPGNLSVISGTHTKVEGENLFQMSSSDPHTPTYIEKKPPSLSCSFALSDALLALCKYLG